MMTVSQPHRWRLLFALGLVAIAAVAWSCGGSGGGDESASTGDTAGPLEVRLVAEDEGGELRFEPSEIRARVGQTVRLVLDNNGLALHDFSAIDVPARGTVAHGAEHEGDRSMALHVASDPGGTGELEFVPTEPGIYVFFCSVEGHREAGMEGRLIVS